MEDYKEKKLKEYLHSSIKSNIPSVALKNSSVLNIAAISILYTMPFGTRVLITGTVFFADRKTFVTDSTGSICLFINHRKSDLKEGCLIEAEGTINKIQGITVISNCKIRIISKNSKLPDPETMTIKDITESPKFSNRGKFIKINNARIKSITLENTAVISDKNGREIIISGFSTSSNLSVGDRINLIGLLSIYSRNHILVRKSEDIIKLVSPEIVNLKPVNLSSTFNRTPEISACLKDNGCEIDFNSIKFYMDERELLPKLCENIIIFIPEEPLSFGEHNLKITAEDIYGYPFTTSWSFIVEDKDIKYNFYYGVPHAHTCYSDGLETPSYAYEYAHRNGLDFLFVADHSNYFDGVTNGNYEYDRNTNQYTEHKNSLWESTRIETEAINAKYNDFVGLRGFEMTSNIWGHINVLNSDCYVEGKKQIRDLNVFFKWLATQRDIIVSINHPGRSFKYLNYVSEMDGVINLIEVGNGAPPRKYKRTEKYYFDSLDSGWHLGAINGQDNHRDNWGDSDNLTVILSEKLNKESLINALKHRRTYSTETRTLKLLYKVNEFWMGSIIEVNPGDTLSFEIEAEDCLFPIECLQIISNGGNIVEEKYFGSVLKACWKPKFKACKNDSWFVVKVIHINGRWGTSSPIFTTGK